MYSEKKAEHDNLMLARQDLPCHKHWRRLEGRRLSMTPFVKRKANKSSGRQTSLAREYRLIL
jgi:hypothetical protein